MKTRLWITMLTATVAMTMASFDLAFARGGRSGGGFSRPSGGVSRPSGGFSGGSRPSIGSSPSFSRPAAQPSRPAARPSTPAARPSTPSHPSIPSTRPSTGAGSRPSVGGGNIGGSRPSIGSGVGNRPSIGGGSVGNRPSQLPSTGIGSGQGIGSGAGIGNRPSTGSGIANRPGISQLPSNRLPGLGAAAGAGALGGATANRLPNQGARIQDRMADRPSVSDRRNNLSDRMQDGRQNWQDNHQQNRGDRQDDRQDWRDNNREDWQNWADDHHHHNDWYHGGWYPGAGWGYMWDNYPVAAAIGLTGWAVNRIGYGWGYWGYTNPYYYETSSYGYDYSQPLVVYADSASISTEATATDTAVTSSTTESPPTDEGMAAFDEARAAFRDGDYEAALKKLDTTLKTMPRDTVVHEFRSLVLFALGKYPESAAAIYAVLAAGPGWDWTTMISLYPGIDPYTKQLRALENFGKANPKSADAKFLLGYHYQTCGHNENAAKQYKLAQALLPDDKLLKQLVAMTSPPGASKTSDTPPAPPTVPPENVLKADQFVGTWKATSQGATFQLDITKEGAFTWTYSRGKEMQMVKGVFAVDQNNLALETDDGGGTMLAEVDFADPSQFKFKMIGDGEKDPGLEFKKS